MPLYDFKCEACEHILEKICSHEKAKDGLECPVCGKHMILLPCKGGGFRIFGFSADNGYMRDEISYDGNPNPKW